MLSCSNCSETHHGGEVGVHACLPVPPLSLQPDHCWQYVTSLTYVLIDASCSLVPYTEYGKGVTVTACVFITCYDER